MGGPVWPCEVDAALDEIIGRREALAHPNTSYTSRLLAGGIDGVLQNPDDADLVWELADLHCHVAVLMHYRRLKRREVQEELRARLSRSLA